MKVNDDSLTLILVSSQLWQLFHKVILQLLKFFLVGLFFSFFSIVIFFTAIVIVVVILHKLFY